MAQTDVCSSDCASFTASYGVCQNLTDTEQQYLCTCDAYQGIGETVSIPSPTYKPFPRSPPPAPQMQAFIPNRLPLPQSVCFGLRLMG